jgi:deferrochelatase/peroxidase EfeB
MDRRKVLGLAGSGAVGAAAAGVVGATLIQGNGDALAAANTSAAVPFYGKHQAGIVTPAQDRLHFVAFNVVTTKRDDVVDLLKSWTAAAARMTGGHDAGTVGAVNGSAEAPPDDTGEALGLPPSGLTLTIGFGPTLFRTAEGKDRFGIAAKRPDALADLPRFPHDAIEPDISGGDLCIQACAHDPQVAVHAVRNLARIGFGVVSVRWSQLGFGRTSSTSKDQATPRNLFGFKDGTANLKAEETDLLRDYLWVSDGWMADGAYLVTRKVRMMIETWDRTSLGEQQTIIGRDKGEGAPLSGGREFDEPDFSVVKDDEPAIPLDAHVRLAHPTQHSGAKLLRRGYNFVDGSDGLGRLNAGLFFMAYQRDPRKQFVPIQSMLAKLDAMNEYVRHTSSALFACPGGVSGRDDYWGRTLFG